MDAALPLLQDGRLRKRWRYVGVWTPTLSICAAHVQVGPARQEFWAVWDRSTGVLHERTRRRRGRVDLADGRLRIADGPVLLELALTLGSPVEVRTPYGRSSAWTRKTVGQAHGRGVLAGRRVAIEGAALLDDSAGFHPRRTRWQWSAGSGLDDLGRTVTWNLVAGLHDQMPDTEDALWIDGVPTRVGPASFDDDLSAVRFTGGALRATTEAERSRAENLLVVRSSYRQPFATFTGSLPGGRRLVSGSGVMEEHDALW